MQVTVIDKKEQAVLDIQRRRSLRPIPPKEAKSVTCVCTGKGCNKQLNKKESAKRYYRCEECYEKMLDEILISPYSCLSCGKRIILPYDKTYVISKHCPECYPKWLRIGKSSECK